VCGCRFDFCSVFSFVVVEIGRLPRNRQVVDHRVTEGIFLLFLLSFFLSFFFFVSFYGEGNQILRGTTFFCGIWVELKEK